ncbi:MFS transporter [Metabacillus sp. RGM 3146]|uniref:MFS transporter n=1 Tax=Metabacillus sp. RGM 3146 TaxID=3401092 RepID=UPI003B9AFF27
MPQLETETASVKKHNVWKLYLSIPILSWALFDFANTIFSSNVITIFFPFYLQETIGQSEKLNQVASTFISYANSVASLFLVLFSPLFGVLIDRTGKKKQYIIPFILITVVFTILMGVFGSLNWISSFMGIPLSLFLVILCFIFGQFFYSSSLVFYDSMISDLTHKRNIPLISGFGVAVGYIGTLAGLGVYPFIGDSGFHRAFIPTAILLLIFSLPLMIFIKDKKQVSTAEKKPFISGYKEIYQTFLEMKQFRSIFLFMIAFFFISDALSTAIAMMAVYAKAIIGFSTGQFIILYLVSTLSSIIGSFIFGYVTRSAGPKKAIFIVGILLLIALMLAVFANAQWMFWIAGSLFGVALGSMWVASRTFIVYLTPDEKRGQFFGLFAFSGKISAIAGPLLYGTITFLFRDYGNLASRMALGSLMLLVLIGLLIHSRVTHETLE